MPRTPADQEAQDKYSALLDWAMEAWHEEQRRFDRTDGKAAQYLSVITLFAGLEGFYVSWIFETILPITGVLEGLICIATIALAIATVLSWFAVFSTFKVHGVHKLPLDDATLTFFRKNRLLDINYHLAAGIKDALRDNRAQGDKKAKRLKWGYRSIMVTVLMLLALSALFAVYHF